MTEQTTKPGQCQVGSGTAFPCHRPAVVRVRGVPFCERCAREQEAYFAIGELTEAPKGLQDNERLVGMLERVRRTTWRSGLHTNESDAA